MASFPRVDVPKGRDFTASELIGRQIRIEDPVPNRKVAPIGVAMMVVADDEMIANVSKIVLTIDPCSVVEATLTLCHVDDTPERKSMDEEITLRDNIEVSFSAIVSEVR